MDEVNERTVLAVILAGKENPTLRGMNLMTLGGMTLTGRAIETARASRCVRTVLVSTDDAAVAAEARMNAAPR